MRNDVTQLAIVVDHVNPLAHGGPDTDDNTENLCAEHDAIVTAKQFGKAQVRRVVGYRCEWMLYSMAGGCGH